MAETQEQAEFRRHLAEMRKAASGLGHDFAREFSDLDQKIERLGNAASREARDLGSDIQNEFARVGRSMDEELRRLPHRFAEAGSAIGSGTARAAGAARDAVVEVGHRAKEGTKNAFAAAAGVKRTPIRSWSAPSSDAEEPPRDGSS
jgi:hypothetical protein